MARIEYAAVDRHIVVAPSPPHEPGVYIFLGSEDRIMYVGMAHDLEKVLYRYRGLAGRQKMRDRAAEGLIKQVAWVRCQTNMTPPSLELLAITRFKPPWNTQHNPRPRSETIALSFDEPQQRWLVGSAKALDEQLAALLGGD